MRALGPLFALGFLAVPATAFAADPEAEDFSPSTEIELAGFEDQTFDTGWIPQGSAVQMRFFLHVGNTITIDMPGEGLYDWEDESIHFEGAEDAGLFEYDVGVRIESKVKFDVQGQKWESDLLGPYDWAIEADEAFTPYLLEGNPDRPVEIHDETDFINVASVPLTPNLIIAEGKLDIDLKAVIDASLQGNRIEVTGLDPAGAMATVTQEWASHPLDPGDAQVPFWTEGLMVCDVATMPDIVVYPHLVFTILGQDFDIAGIEIPVEVPTIDEEIELDPVQMEFADRPEPEPGDPGDTGGDGDTGGESGEGESGDAGAGGAAEGEGCGCRSAGDEGPVGGLLVLSALALVRRRR